MIGRANQATEAGSAYFGTWSMVRPFGSNSHRFFLNNRDPATITLYSQGFVAICR
jgi:hypothetical protein